MKIQIVLNSFDVSSFRLVPRVLPIVAVARSAAASRRSPLVRMPSQAVVPAEPTIQSLKPAMNQRPTRQTNGGMYLKSWVIFLAAMLSVIQSRADDNSPTNSVVATSTTYSHASDMSGRFGVGLVIGEPTGASLKYFINDTFAVDGVVGWSFHNGTDFTIQSDVLWHKFDLVSLSEGQLPFYIGGGMRVKFHDNAQDQIGFRLPIGVSYIFEHLPLDVFFEVAPVIDFTPSTRGGFTAGVGARWWF